MITTRRIKENNSVEIYIRGANTNKDRVLAVIPPQPFYEGNLQDQIVQIVLNAFPLQFDIN